MKKKVVVFEHRILGNSNDREEEELEFEFGNDVTDEEIEQKIEEEYKEWVWNRISEHFSWYEKGSN